MAVPVVRPSYTPDRISTASDSRRCVTWREEPGLRRSSSRWISSFESSSPGGQPSTTPPWAGPCDSPKEVTQNSVPKVLPDIDPDSIRPSGGPVRDVPLQHPVLEILLLEHRLGHVAERDHAEQPAAVHHRKVARAALQHHAAQVVDL